MNKIVLAMLTITLTSCATTTHENDGRIVLPKYRVAECSSPRCAVVWPDKPSGASAIYPQQVIIDFENTSVRGMTVLYDKSVPIDEIGSTIDGRYGKWALATNATSPVKLWRVEPEKFAIQLGTEDNGMKHVIYLTFQPAARVFEDWVNSGAFSKQAGSATGEAGQKTTPFEGKDNGGQEAPR